MDGLDFGPCRAIGVVAGRDPGNLDAKVQAAVVFSNYHPTKKTCEVSVAATTPMWARPDIIYALLSVPFEQFGCDLIWSAMPVGAERVIRFNEHLGFKRESVLRHRFGWKNHAVITSMTKFEFQRKWKNGQISAIPAACA